LEAALSDFLHVTQQRALRGSDPALLQVSFDASALQRYRDDAACQVMRTDTVGRVRKPGAFTFDFGIAPDEKTLHASWQALITALPDAEREHWALHATPASGYSDMFLRMALSPSSCFDDGDLRPW
jgi:hypothetical protein